MDFPFPGRERLELPVPGKNLQGEQAYQPANVELKIN